MGPSHGAICCGEGGPDFVSIRLKSENHGLAVILRALEGGGALRDMVLLCNALAAKGVPPAILALHAESPLRGLLDPAIRVFEVSGKKTPLCDSRFALTAYFRRPWRCRIRSALKS
jgi:hypothetical protein